MPRLPNGSTGRWEFDQRKHEPFGCFFFTTFFWELALLDTEPRSATAIALSSVTLFRIDQEDFFDLMTEREEVLRNMIRVLSQRIRS